MAPRSELLCRRDDLDVKKRVQLPSVTPWWECNGAACPVQMPRLWAQGRRLAIHISTVVHRQANRTV